MPHGLLAGGQTPGDVHGFGCLPADAMRRLVAATHLHLSTWAVTLVDPASGRPTAHARQTRRPNRPRPEPGAGWLIEFMLPADAVDGDPQVLDPFHLAPPGVLATLLAKARAAPTDWCATSHARTAHGLTRAQKHFVQARDRYCCFPGCRRRAVTRDVDHLVPHERSGPTCPCNLHPLCRRHHQTKQEPGWVLTADHTTGRCRWASPHGLRAANDTHRLHPRQYERQ